MATTNDLKNGMVLRIDGETPGLMRGETGHEYPLIRDLLLVTGAPSDAAVDAFLDFCLSPAGQELAGRKHGRIR